MTRHQEPMTTRSTALLQQIEGGVLGRYRSCLFSGHDTPPAQLTLPLPSVYHLHSQFATLVFLTVPRNGLLCSFFLGQQTGVDSRCRLKGGKNVRSRAARKEFPMARRSPRPEATQQVVLKPFQQVCDGCG